MTSDAFPAQLLEAAAKWQKYCTAFAQLREADNSRIEVRLQALQIMRQFVGSVEFGRDPLGILFYHAQPSSELGEVSFRVTYLPSQDNVNTVKIDFYEDSGTNPCARWVSRVDTMIYPLPPPSNRLGSGQWKSFKALSSEARIHKISCSDRVRLRFQPLLRQVHFNLVPQSSNQPIDTHGILIAVNISQLTGVGTVDYAPDRLVFYHGETKEVVALFLPDFRVALPIPPPDGLRSSATWDLYQPSVTINDSDKFPPESEILTLS